ncbi:MAG: methionine--tRNA ligase [Planctomycetota bacterium]|nr:methionine--tRNA ligase [Planctomycetota bacterium]
MAQNYYITTPIYYVNDRPHIGHIYTTILADVFARSHRLLGDDVFFLTGTDEHGQKVQDAAEARGLEPIQHADEMVVQFQEIWKDLDISNDEFIRTTEARHTSVVSEVLSDLYDRGEIYVGEYEGWYCKHCERFWTKKDLVEGNCPNPDCQRPVSVISEKNYFFRMGKRRDWLIDHIRKNENFILPASRRNEVLGFLDGPLGDLCISRSRKRLSWGIPLPFDEDYVTYVWFDALLNYVSGVGYRRDDAFEKWWPASLHLIGKDIVTTHCVYWPTMLEAMGLPLPKSILAHGWWTQGGEKVSKSKGGAIDPRPLIEKIGLDAFRTVLLREMIIGADAGYSEERLVARYHSDLANDLGNLHYRTLSMIEKFLGGKVPKPGPGGSLQEKAESLKKDCRSLVESYSFNDLLDRVFDLVREGNRVIDREQPWRLAREEKTEELERVLYGVAEAVRIAFLYLSPLQPTTAAKARSTLGLDGTWGKLDEEGKWGGLRAGSEVRIGKPLFPRLEPGD